MFTEPFPFRHLLLSGLVALLFLAPLRAQEKLVQTIAPSKVLQAFPSAPPEWRLLESKAQNLLSVNGMPNTTAIRRYELPLPKEHPPTAAATPAPPPPRLRIIVLDQGSRHQAEPLAEADNSENRLHKIGSITGHLRQFPHRIIFETNPAARLVIQVESRHMELSQLREIITRLDWQSLLTLKDKLPTTLIPAHRDFIIEDFKEIPIWVYEIENERIDELNPKRNRKWKSSQFDR